MGKSSLPKVHRYSMHFKATAVRLSKLPDVLIQDVAEALDKAAKSGKNQKREINVLMQDLTPILRPDPHPAPTPILLLKT